jgi:DNA polymerase-3 subunit gamma/tau
MFERMLRCCDELGKTLQPRLVLDCALIDVATIEPLVPLGDLIDRLTELEGRLAGRPGARTGGSGGGAKEAPRPRPAPAPAPPPSRPPVRSAPVEPPPPSAPSFAPAPSASSFAPAPSAPSFAPPPSAPSFAPPPTPPRPVPAPAPVEPSGPVPRPSSVASGSGPHIEAPRIPVPGNAHDALRAWGDVLNELHEQRFGTLAGPFEHARVMVWTVDQLELGFPVDQHVMGEFAKDRTDELRNFVRGLNPAFKNLRVTLRMLDATESASAGARSVLETSREHKSAERSKREAEARAHPITKHVLQTFGAQIKEIKTDV